MNLNEIFEFLLSWAHDSGSGFSGELFDNNLYGTCGIITVAVSIIFAFGFYFLFDKARYVGFRSWFIALSVTFLLLFVINIVLTMQSVFDHSIVEHIYFAIILSLLASILFFIISLIIKPFRTNLSHSPF
jgi:hypothetical protein